MTARRWWLFGSAPARWRGALGLVLFLVVGLPLAFPFGGLFDPSAWPGAEAWWRVAVLARNTAVLVGLVWLLAVPAGVGLAVLLFRTDLPGRGLFSLLLLLGLFVPLPLLTSGWQTVLGPGGIWPMALWDAAPGWAPWTQGVGPAAWVHAVAGLPWVVLLVGLGLAGVERELEEDALLVRGPAGVLTWVTLPRCAGSIAAALVWLAVQASTEIVVTDVMQVRTFAEEVYTQFVAPEPDPMSPNPLGRAVAVSLLGLAVYLGLVLWLAWRVGRVLPAGWVPYRPAVRIRLGWGRWPMAVLLAGLTGGLLAVPVAGLVWRAGLTGMPAEWSLSALLYQLRATLVQRTAHGWEMAPDAVLLGRTLGVAGLTGVLCASLALLGCWLARESRRLAAGLLVLLTLAWVMPGPVVGLGLKGVFRVVLDATGWPGGLADALWYGPSSLPLVWVYVVRLLPFAAALLWPVVRLVPRPLAEMARLDGAGVVGEVRWVAWPALWRAWLVAVLAVGVLSLGELAGGKLVSTPGAESYAEALFSQMHYGVGADLAARCLWLLLVVGTGAGVIGWVARRPG